MTPEPPDRGGQAPGGSRRRAVRADALRNRERVLRAADAVFAEAGIATSTEAVARAAGVGVGTVFRHFPTKDALLAAVFAARLRRLADQARALAGAQDPGASFHEFFAHVIAQAATKQTFVAALSAIGRDTEHPVGADLLEALATLLRRAQQHGAVRDDVGVTDVVALLVGTTRAAEYAGWDAAVQARLVAVVRDGLRSGARGAP